MILATLALCALAPAPQEPLLKPPDQQKLAQKLADLIEAKILNSAKDSTKDPKAAEKESKAHDAFEKEFDRLGKKLNDGAGLLSSPVDLDLILQAAGNWVKSEGGPGKVSTGKAIGEGGAAWAHWAPKTYEPKAAAYPLVLWLLPSGTNPRNWLTEETASSPLVETHLIAAVVLPKSSGGESTAATAAAMVTLNGALSTLRVDHNRIFLGAKAADCPFALELANRFPHRFAGLILLAPEGNPPECKNLSGVGIYLAGNAEPWTKELEAAKTELQAGEIAPASIAEWVPNHRRQAYPDAIQFFPAHRAARQSYWVRIEPEWTIGADKQVSLDPAKRPSFDVKVDREKNRITAQATRVKNIEFLLNDALVDLSKPVAIDVNGRVTEVQKARDLRFFLAQFVRSGDRGSSFTASFLISDIPKSEAEKAAAAAEKAAADKPPAKGDGESQKGGK